MVAVTEWLDAAGLEYTLRGVSNLDVVAPHKVAEALLETKFHVAKHATDKYSVVRAGEYTLPKSVYNAVATIFGLHGLPLPRKVAASSGEPLPPADVTPSVIYQTYGVTPQKVRRAADNRQAVAEFQGQFMNSTDLVNMFKRYVTKYEEGVDDKVTKFIGEHIENSGGIEAELDIQYIMGTAPGIQSEFWEFPGQDFGADLNMWTSNLTAKDDVPLVHSVSYGWQGNLSQIGVKMADVNVVDANFAKLAAKGISIMISSGDSGSGYAESDPCMGSEGAKGVGIDGTVEKTIVAMGYEDCCEEGNRAAAKGWQFAVWPKSAKLTAAPSKAACLAEMEKLCGNVAHGPGCQKCIHDHTSTLYSVCHGTGSGQEFCAPKVTATMVVHNAHAPGGTSIKFKNSVYHEEIAEAPKPIFHPRDLFKLTGTVSLKEGGTVKAIEVNGTLKKSATITFGPGTKQSKAGPVTLFNISAKFGSVALTGRAEAIAFPGMPAEVFTFEWFCPGERGELCYIWEHGPNPPPPPPPPPPGTCTIFSDVTSHTTANSTTFSGFAAKTAVVLWASWPASSPWVTSVGATRFENQKAGNPEMASDQFGSGGGFYDLFTTDIEFQAAAVKKYLNTVDPSTLPPADSFDATARATPDVAALGEGFQVIVDGRPMAVGGTSASSPTFAGLVSLLNEARIAAGKKQMGFLNPFVYQNEDAFFDVTAGSNKIGRGGQPLPYGFNCSAGWDPATGLGTPLFSKLLKAAMDPGAATPAVTEA